MTSLIAALAVLNIFALIGIALLLRLMWRDMHGHWQRR